MALDYKALHEKHKKRDEENWEKEKNSTQNRQNKSESPSVKSSGSGDIYDGGAQRRQTNVDSRSAEAQRANADMKARNFVNANRGKETAYYGTGANDSKVKTDFVVTTTGGVQKPAESKNNLAMSDIDGTALRESARKQNVLDKIAPLEERGKEYIPQEVPHVATDKSKSKTQQIAQLTKNVANEEFTEREVDRKNAISSSEERVSSQYTATYENMSPDAKALLSFINREEETETNINWMAIASGLSGQSGSNAAAAGQYAAALTTSDEARRMLKDLYGMSDDEIDAAVILHKRARNEEIAIRQEEEMKAMAQEAPFLSSVAAVGMGISADVMPVFETFENYKDKQTAKALGMGDIGNDPNSIYSAHRKSSDTIQNSIAQNIEQKHGELAAQTYLGAMGGVINFAEGMVFGKATEGVLTVNAGLRAYDESIARGLSKEDARKTAAVAMAAEFIGEHIGGVAFRSGKKLIGKSLSEILEKGFTTKTLKGLLGTSAKTIFGNGLEEGLTSTINTVYDTVANGDLSQYQVIVDNCIESGLSPEEAQKEATKEIAKSIVSDVYSGMVSGVLFNTSNVVNYGMNQMGTASTGRAVKDSGLTTAVIAEGQAAPAGSKTKKLADSLAAKSTEGKKISDYKAGKLVEQNAKITNEASEGAFKDAQSKEELTEAYEEKKLEIANDDSLSKAEKSKKLEDTRKQFENAVSASDMKASFARKLGRELAEVDRAEATNPTAEIDGKSVTVDGGNFDAKTKSFGEFKGIFKDKDGDIAVKTTDGTQIKVSELKTVIKDKTVARLYEKAEGLSAQAANLFIDNYDGESIDEYGRAFDYYYKMGRTGLGIDKIRENDNRFGNYLSAEAQVKIAAEGLKDREFRKGFTDLSVTRKTERYRFESRVLQYIGEKRNLEIFVIDEDSNINGTYLTGTNRIVIRRNAEGKLLLRTASHESFHFIKNQIKDEAGKAELQKLENFVIDVLEKNGTDIEAEIRRLSAITDDAGNAVYATREDCVEEIVANSMFDAFMNEKFVKKAMNENASLFTKISNKVKELLADIRAAVKALSVKDAAVRALKDDIESLEKINAMFDSLLEKAGEQYKAEHGAGQKNNADDGVKYSFAAAERSRGELITKAESMEKEGASKEDIWKKLGVIRDASGIWVYEIDDSAMKIYPNGDARLRNEDGYKRMTELFNRFISGEKITEAEQNELKELQREYNLRKKMNVFVKDFISHDELFKEYPELEWVSFEFDDLKSKNARGYFSPAINAIVVDESLRKQIESRQLSKTAIHEIQHAVQHIDDRAGGSTAEYFEEQQKWFSHYKKSVDGFLEKNGLKDFVKTSMKEVADGKKTIDEHWADLDEWTKNTVDSLGSAMIQSHYNSMLRYKRYMSGEAESLYYNTAGEIEARETAKRLGMTAEERAEKMPDLGWERAVFAEGSSVGYDIGKTTDNKPVVIIKDDILSEINSTDWIDTVKNTIKTKFSQGIPIAGRLIKVNRTTWKEYTGSKDTKRLQRKNAVIYKDKLTASNNLDEIVLASTNYVNEDLNHQRKDNIVEFARGDVLMQIGNNNYKAEVIVGLTKNSSMVLYDIVNFTNDTFKIKKEDAFTDQNENKEVSRHYASSDNRVSQNTPSVNNDSMKNLDNYAPNQKLSVKASAETLSELKEKREGLVAEYRELRAKIDEIKSSAEYKAFDDEVRTLRKNGARFGGFEAVKEVRNRQKQWAEAAGLSALEERYDDISGQIHDSDLEIYKADKELKAKATAQLTEKVSKFTENEIKDYATKAAKRFGITKKFDNAGYMLPDGGLLDFSDGQGYRVLDHREIRDVLDFLPEDGNRSDGLIQFMNMGNIRMQIGGIDISRAPTKEQIAELRRFFDKNNGEITVDFSKDNGDNAGTLEYPEGTSSIRILNDIKKYFESGELPQISATAAFHSMYSQKQQSGIQAYWAETVRENHSFRNILSLLGEMQIAGGKVQLSSKDIDRIVRDTLKSTSSAYDKAKLTDELTVLYDYLANSGQNADTEEIYTNLLNIANGILEQSEMKDSELFDQYKNVRDYLRTQPIYITPAVKKEIESQFGDYKSFRNILMGKAMRLSTTNEKAATLDEVWQELSELAPEYFPKDMNELDMPMQLTAFFEAVAPKVVNPYEHFQENIEDAAAELATDIFQKYFEVSRLKNPQEKYSNLVFENMRKLEENKKAIRQEFKKKAAEDAEGYRMRIAEYKLQREQGDKRRRMRNELDRNYNYLNRRIVKETDNDHIPEKLKDAVSAFRFIVPDGNSYFSRAKFAEFENEYRKLEETTTFFDEGMAQRISALGERLTQGVGAPRMRDLDNFELEELRNISEHMKYVVQNENRLFSDRLKGRIEDYAKAIHGELEGKKESRAQGLFDNAKIKDRFVNGIDSLIKGFTKPEYLFGSIGSDTVKQLFDELRRGENTEARIIFDAKKAEEEIKKKYNYDPRWNSEKMTVNFRGGKLTMTVEQAMALYATSKRKQGLEHMLGGGVLLYTSEEIQKKNGKSKEVTKRGRHVFHEADIPVLQNSLTADQKKYVNAMVDYITKEIGAKRNEVSMKLLGVERYKENYYFPIKVDRHFVDTSVGRQEVVSTIRNQSSAKRTVDHAQNPIEITGFTDTVNNHIYDSALYCAYVLPINDFKRVYNYRDKELTGEGAESLMPKDVSIKEDIRRTNGVNAIKQIEDFMIALDSGSRYENLIPLSAKMMSMAKKGTVMANLSVVVQQPTAVFRAMLYVNPKYFATWANKADIEEMKKYNGCALKKEIGYFDVNMGRTATDYMNEYTPDKDIKKDWSLADRIRNGNLMLKADQLAGWGAEKADEMTWGAIWKACKKQTKTENSELKGDALNEAAAELFQTVIGKTQVYDSVFTKPDYMRRKEGLAMMTTSFMSEPLTSLNMLAEAVINAKNAKGSNQAKEAAKFCARAFGCYAVSLVVNNAVKSLIYTMRDDDEDESILEQYVANVLDGTMGDVVGMVPYIKDIFSIIQGYDPSRMDAAAFTTAVDAVKSLFNENKSIEDKITLMLKAVGQASGIPLYNVVRDAKAIIGFGRKIADGIQNGFEPSTGRGMLNEIKETFEWVPFVEADSKYEQLYKAVVEGDTRHFDKVMNNLKAEGKEEATINSGIATELEKHDMRIADAYYATASGETVKASGIISELEGEGFSKDVINRALKKYENNLKKKLDDDERVIKAAEARYNMDYDEYERIVDELVAEGHSEKIVKDKINSEKIELETKEDDFEVNEKPLYAASYDLKNAMINGNESDVRKVYRKLLSEADSEDANAEVRKYAAQAYKSGDITESQLTSYYTSYKSEGDDEDDIFWKVEDVKGGEGYRKYGKLYDAIDSGRNLSGTIDYYTSHGVELKTVKSNITSEYKPKLTSLTPGTAEYREMYDNVIDAFVAAGDTEAAAIKKVNKW